eukprot:scaffold2003_cov139-Cylindrotheca_fusiformis.AAC.3
MVIASVNGKDWNVRPMRSSPSSDSCSPSHVEGADKTGRRPGRIRFSISPTYSMTFPFPDESHAILSVYVDFLRLEIPPTILTFGNGAGWTRFSVYTSSCITRTRSNRGPSSFVVGVKILLNSSSVVFEGNPEQEILLMCHFEKYLAGLYISLVHWVALAYPVSSQSCIL